MRPDDGERDDATVFDCREEIGRAQDAPAIGCGPGAVGEEVAIGEPCLQGLDLEFGVTDLVVEPGEECVRGQFQSAPSASATVERPRAATAIKPNFCNIM